jgi:hypothetical protein
MRRPLDLREAGGRGDLLRDQGGRNEVQGQAGCRALQGPFGRDGVCRELHELLRCLWRWRLRDHDDNDHSPNHHYNGTTALRRESLPVLQRHV